MMKVLLLLTIVAAATTSPADQCGKGARYEVAADLRCPDTCQQLYRDLTDDSCLNDTSKASVSGCVCKDGYVKRNSTSEECIDLEDCPETAIKRAPCGRHERNFGCYFGSDECGKEGLSKSCETGCKCHYPYRRKNGECIHRDQC